LIPSALAIGCLPWLILFVILVSGLAVGGKKVDRGNHIALIRIEGIITAGRSGGGFMADSVSGSEDIVAEIEKAVKSRSAKAILLRINSPGGSPSGSEEIYNAITRARNSGKPVYVSMGDVAASGGYFIASAADRIYADSSTLTGSIGVIFASADLSELFRKIGYNTQVVKSGKFKDVGSAHRSLTPEERQMLQAIVDDTFQTFVSAVARGRKMNLDDVRKLADGRVYTGNQAKAAKLIDEIGGLHETVAAVGSASGMSGAPKVIEYGKKSFFDVVFDSSSSGETSGLERAVRREILQRLIDGDAGAGGLR